MAIRLNSTSKLIKLYQQIQRLEDIPRKLPMQGLLRNIFEKKLPYDVFVNKWPNYDVIVTKPETCQQHTLPVYRLGIYANDHDALTTVLSQPHFLPSTIPINVVSLPIELIPVIERIAELYNMKEKWIGRDDKRMIVTNPSPIEPKDNIKKRIKQTFYCSEINIEKYYKQIANSWNYKNDLHGREIFEAVKYYMESGPTIGMYLKDTCQLVSWIISNIDRSHMVAHTLPEYRRKGLLQYLVHELSIQRLLMGDIFWATVREKSLSSAEAVIQVGGKLHHDVKLVHCKMIPVQANL